MEQIDTVFIVNMAKTYVRDIDDEDLESEI